MYQLMRRILEDPNDKTSRLWLIYANKTEKDILLKAELDTLQRQHPDRLQILYVLERAPSDWTGEHGWVSESMIRNMIKKEDLRRLIFVCGPEGMLAHVSGQRARDFSQGPVTGILGKMGFTSKEVWKLE